MTFTQDYSSIISIIIDKNPKFA